MIIFKLLFSVCRYYHLLSLADALKDLNVIYYMDRIFLIL